MQASGSSSEHHSVCLEEKNMLIHKNVIYRPSIFQLHISAQQNTWVQKRINIAAKFMVTSK